MELLLPSGVPNLDLLHKTGKMRTRVQRMSRKRSITYLYILAVQLHFLRLEVDSNGANQRGGELVAGPSVYKTALSHARVAQDKNLDAAHVRVGAHGGGGHRRSLLALALRRAARPPPRAAAVAVAVVVMMIILLVRIDRYIDS